MNEATIYAAARESARWNSMDPERFAAGCAREFDVHMEAVRSEFRAVSPDAEKADAEFAEYRAGYERRYRAWLAARGRTASAMVAGPSNFPTRRNAKPLDAERKRADELNEWSARARKSALKRLKPPRDAGADADALEQQLERMKAANRIVRRAWPEERKIAALVTEVGLSDALARKVLEPDFAGRVGFPSYGLNSLRGKIKRLRGAA